MGSWARPGAPQQFIASADRRVAEIIGAHENVGRALRWKREAELNAVGLDGPSDLLAGGRCALTNAHPNKGKRELPQNLVDPLTISEGARS